MYRGVASRLRRSYKHHPQENTPPMFRTQGYSPTITGIIFHMYICRKFANCQCKRYKPSGGHHSGFQVLRCQLISIGRDRDQSPCLPCNVTQLLGLARKQNTFPALTESLLSPRHTHLPHTPQLAHLDAHFFVI